MNRVVFEYQPLPVFVAFHASAAPDRAVIGGYGSGKSTAACAEAIRIGLEQPGSEILVTRKTAPALRDTTEKTFQDLIPPKLWDVMQKSNLIHRAGGHFESVTFPNGSNYMFRSMDDWKKHRSMNLACILWDEADEFTQDDYEGMQSRVRQVKPSARARAQGAKRITWNGNILACNPQGKNWVWKKFVSDDKDVTAEAFISSSLDNPHLPRGTLDRWLAMPDAWVRRYVLCSFDDFSGAIYPDFGFDTHVVAPPKYTSEGWFCMGFDPGTFAGNAAVWAYYDKNAHRLVAVAEYNESGLAATQHCDSWRALEAKHGMRFMRYRVADPVVTTRDRGSNMELSEQYRRLGFRFDTGPRKIETRLTALGQLIHQRRFVVSTECPQLYEQLKAYRWEDLSPVMKEKGAEAKPLKRNVDLVDAAQYLATRYVAPPKIEAVRTDEARRNYEIHQAIKQQLQDARNATPEHDLGSLPL